MIWDTDRSMVCAMYDRDWEAQSQFNLMNVLTSVCMYTYVYIELTF